VELSQYLPLLLKLVVVVYAVLCLGELLHRWSSGGRCSLSLVRLSSQQQRCSAVQCSAVLGANRRLMLQTQSSSSAAASPSKALPFSGSTKQVPGSICFFVCSVYAC